MSWDILSHISEDVPLMARWLQACGNSNGITEEGGPVSSRPAWNIQ